METGNSTSGPADYVGESRRACPSCGEPLSRVRRRLVDRIMSLFTPVRRYRCRSYPCGWEGTLPVDRKLSSGGAPQR